METVAGAVRSVRECRVAVVKVGGCGGARGGGEWGLHAAHGSCTARAPALAAAPVAATVAAGDTSRACPDWAATRCCGPREKVDAGGCHVLRQARPALDRGDLGAKEASANTQELW